jgi:hypothetical protein
MAPSRYYSNTSIANTIGNSGGISNSAASVYCASAPSGYPSQFPFTLALDPGTSSMELVSVTSGAGTSGSPWAISRGFDGTTAVAHSPGAVIAHDLSAYDVSTSRAHEAAQQSAGPHGLPATAWDTAAFAEINETILTNSTTAVQTWNSIPGTYSHLLVVILGRLTETTALTDYLTMQFNGDSGAYYSFVQNETNNTSGTLSAPTATTTFGGSSAPFGRLTASQGGAAVNAGAIFAIIPWYTSTAFNKVVLSMTGAGDGTSALVDGRVMSGFYNPPTQAAVTSLSVSAPSGSFFKSGTALGLYGLS